MLEPIKYNVHVDVDRNKNIKCNDLMLEPIKLNVHADVDRNKNIK